MAIASVCRALAAKATNWSTKKMRGDEPRISFSEEWVVMSEEWVENKGRVKASKGEKKLKIRIV